MPAAGFAYALPFLLPIWCLLLVFAKQIIILRFLPGQAHSNLKNSSTSRSTSRIIARRVPLSSSLWSGTIIRVKRFVST